jgi:hypothetical protein
MGFFENQRCLRLNRVKYPILCWHDGYAVEPTNEKVFVPFFTPAKNMERPKRYRELITWIQDDGWLGEWFDRNIPTNHHIPHIQDYANLDYKPKQTASGLNAPTVIDLS